MSKIEKRTVTVRHKYGIHARPAAKIVALSNTFNSDIEVVKDGEPPANAKNILDVMMLAASPGVNLELRIKGDDAIEAMEKLATLMESDFGNHDV
ncbi:MAG: HPr family phosphocarrier protein [Planctomycetota bacterium]|nr:HPr family phosphocarrier protein [Planctomycetota bacterium]